MNRKYKNAYLQRNYDAIMAVARDPSSKEMYVNGRQHTGASHRCAFWAGYNGGAKPLWVGGTDTLGHIFWMAGRDFAKEKPGIPK